MLVDAAPAIKEEVVTGEVEILATFSTSVRKAVSANKKAAIAGCKVFPAKCSCQYADLCWLLLHAWGDRHS